jgi:hypothetical protein
LAKCVAQGKYTLLRPGSFFFTPGSANGRIELVLIESVEQRRRFELAAASCNAQFQGMRACGNRIFVPMHDQSRADLPAEPIAEFDHLLELVTRVDMKEGKWKRSGEKRLARQMNEDARVLSDGVQQDGISELRRGFAQNVNRFAFKLAKMGPILIHASERLNSSAFREGSVRVFM